MIVFQRVAEGAWRRGTIRNDDAGAAELNVVQ